MGFDGIYPLVMTNVAMENGPLKSWIFPFKMVIYIALLNYQRITLKCWIPNWMIWGDLRDKSESSVSHGF